MHNILISLSIGGIILAGLLHPALSVAQTTGQCSCTINEASEAMPEFNTEELCYDQVLPNGQEAYDCTWNEIAQTEAADTGKDPLFSEDLTRDIDNLNKFKGKNVPQVIGTLIKLGMGVMGTLALLLFVYGGIIWMLARGNEEMQRKGFDTIVWGSLGVAVMLASYALVAYVFGAFL